MAAQAQVLLNIDLTNPNAVTITSTGAAAAASSSGTDFRVRLIDFYAAPVPGVFGFIFPTSGNLVNATSSMQYDRALVAGGSRQLIILQSFAAGTQTFVAGQLAFTGSNTVNMSAVTGNLPTAPFTGNIEVLTDFGVPTGVIIGQYQVTAVPEPATMTALALGAAALLRRRKKQG